jgi:hypothetical protein
MPQNFNNEEYNIIVEKYEVYGDYQIKDNIERLSTFIFIVLTMKMMIFILQVQEIMIDYMVLYFLWDLKQFTVMPYVRINNEGMKEYDLSKKLYSMLLIISSYNIKDKKTANYF